MGFFGGPPPPLALLEPAAGHPIHVRVRPDLLSREEASRLQDAGVVSVELDILTLDDRTLKSLGRRYSSHLVIDQLEGLASMGFEVGAVVAPGLPGLNHQASLDDAIRLAPLIDTVRIHPALVIRFSGLYRAMLDERFTPLKLGEAITVCRDLIDVFEDQDVRVIRVGQQEGPDQLGPVVAGPVHSSLRELVEARRCLDRLKSMVIPVGVGGPTVVWIACSPQDMSRVRGPKNQHIRDLRAMTGAEVHVVSDARLPRGRYELRTSKENES